MPSFQEIYDAISEEMGEWKGEPVNYWKGIYRSLLWYDKGVPHIVEANDLKKEPWRSRAKQVEARLAESYRCQPGEVSERIDQISKRLGLQGKQRNNYTGIGFTAAICSLMRDRSRGQYEFIPEAVVGRDVFQGVTHPPRQRIDLVAVHTGRRQEYAIISMKWSVRHDRLRDLLDECNFYKINARLPYYFVVTNEFNPSRISVMLRNRCINGLFHLNKQLLLEVQGRDRLLEGVSDLTDLFGYF